MHSPELETRHLEALLDFYLASGIDSFVGEMPVDWVEASRAARPQSAGVDLQQAGRAQAPMPNMVPKAAPIGSMARPGEMQQDETPSSAGDLSVPDEVVVASAREAARSAGSLGELRACLEAFSGCNLKLTAKTLVFSDGNPEARVMFVGEAPGRDEDMQGRPFVGRSGQLLDRMLTAVGLDRTSAYIANVVPWRPPGNRTPTPQETEICKPFIVRQIELVNPDILVFLGAASAKSLIGTQEGIRKMRGRWMKYQVGSRDVSAIATYHPAYLLRSPLEKRLSWRDFLAIRQRLGASTAD